MSMTWFSAINLLDDDVCFQRVAVVCFMHTYA